MELILEDRPAPPRDRTALWSRVVVVAAALVAAGLGLVVGARPILAILPLIFAAPILLWKKPYYGVVFLMVTCTTIENFPTPVGTHKGAFTSYITWWRTIPLGGGSAPSGTNGASTAMSHGMILFPVEMFLMLLIIIWILKAGLESTLGLPKSPVTTGLKVFWCLIILGIGVGMTHGANLKFNLWETRSWIYLTAGFLLAAALLRTRQALDAMLWAMVLGTGFKGMQGTQIFLSYARSMNPRPEAILGHEEAFFMGVFILLTAALWLYSVRGPLRSTATALFPFVLIADMANSRRTSWLVLALGILVMLAIGFNTLPHRRKFLGRTIIVLAIGSAIYVPVYWNHNGSLAQPARAVRSEIQPSSRDESSDVYRLQEDYNLEADIKTSGILGAGFGVPIAYSNAIANISSADPMVAYIPHNGILWIWFRLGLQGEIVFWCLIAAALMRATRLAKVSDPKFAMIGTVAACAIVGYLAEGYEDYGFAEFRIALAMGCILGMVEAATRIAASRSATEASRIEVLESV
jgi:hypothetical protein